MESETYQLHNQDLNLHPTVCTPLSTSGVRWGYCLMWQLSLDQIGNQTDPVTKWAQPFSFEHTVNSSQLSVQTCPTKSVTQGTALKEICTIINNGITFLTSLCSMSTARWEHGRRMNINYMRCEILTALLVKSQIFWDMMPCRLVDIWSFHTSPTFRV